MPTISIKQNPFQISILIAIGVIVTLGVVGAILSKDKAVNILGFCSVVEHEKKQAVVDSTTNA